MKPRKSRHPYDTLSVAVCEYLAFRGWSAMLVPGSAIGVMVEADPGPLPRDRSRRFKVVVEVLATRQDGDVKEA